MNKPKHHILICSSSRIAGEPVGACNKRGAANLVQYVQNEAADRGIEGVLVSNTGCLKICDEGPVMVIYPEGYWYGKLTEESIDDILDALEEGRAVENLLII
ncbi:MAG: (2Fe-2S) ferredoxin domain-containing protein [Armatimonadota bacterium]